MKPHFKDILLGMVVGLLANAIGTFLYITLFSEYNFEDTIRFAAANKFLGKLITLGAVLNLLAFFVFIRKHKYYRARGVLLATIMVAIALLLLKMW